MPGRRDFLRSIPALALVGSAHAAVRIPPRTVVLTLDDAVKSHRTFVGPLLKEFNFGASFFVTHAWMSDAKNFMTWRDIAELHEMGFEIGNHAWTHGNYSTPRGASHFAGELALTENELKKVGVPRPVSYAWCGNAFGPEAFRILAETGFRFARRGAQPEVPYGKLQIGAAFDPATHHPLLIPTTGDAYPDWTPDHFQKVLAEAKDGRAVILQFHGVPDVAHPWVHTPPENFRRYMGYLRDHKFRVIALRDLEPYLDLAHPPDDTLARTRFPTPKAGRPPLAVETEQTQSDLPYWTAVMASLKYTPAEVARVAGQPAPGAGASSRPLPPVKDRLTVLPYPGGRHPRIGFLDGAIDPLRGTKACVFLPWDPTSYVVIDLPEAIFTKLGLLFLAHTHVPTIWNDRNITTENTDWRRLESGGLANRWALPNGMAITASLQPRRLSVDMEVALENRTPNPVTGIQTQVCVMLKGAPGFNEQTLDNKVLRQPLAGVRGGPKNDRWIVTSWSNCNKVWANDRVPCIHSDAPLADCPPGQTVRITGRLWFSEGQEISDEPEA